MEKLKITHPLLILLVTNAMVLVGNAMIGPIYAIFVERIGGGLLDASGAFALYSLSASITAMIVGRVTDRAKEDELVVVLGYAVMAVSFVGYVFVSQMWQFFLVQIIAGIGHAIQAPSFDAVYSKHIGKGHSGTVWGAWEGMNYMTMSLGAIIGGFVASQFGFDAMFLLMTVLVLFSALYVYFLPRKVL
jgi:predicted MFS family arabinose efflux permease